MSFEDALEKLLSLGIYKCLAERVKKHGRYGRERDLLYQCGIFG